MSIQLSIIIPVRNRWDLTEQCLQSLAKTCPEDDYEVIVIDNASSDATKEACLPVGKNLFSERFHLLRNDPPLPFAASCNAGAKIAQGDLLFMLNNDTIALPGWRKPLQDTLESDPSLGAVGPLLLYPKLYGLPDRVQHLGICFCPIVGVGHLYEGFPVNHPVVQKKRRFQAITAAAMLLQRQIFFDLDGFYEEYSNGFEDVDFCLRLGQKGYSMTVVPESRIYHLCGQTPQRYEQDNANSRLVLQRCGKCMQIDTHQFLRADGYDLRLNCWLRYEPILPEKRRFQLTRLLKKQDKDQLLQALHDEPFWKEGYLALADFLQRERERERERENAINVLMLGTKFFFTPDILLPILHLAEQAEYQKLVSILGETMQDFVMEFDARIKSLHRVRTNLRNIDLQLAESAGKCLARFDDFLTRSYTPFLQEMERIASDKKTSDNSELA